MSDRVTLSVVDGVADVRFNRADKRNALDNEQFIAIAAMGERLKTEPGVRVVVISGNGPSFCAGLDLSSMAALANSKSDGGAAASAEGNPGQMKEGRSTHLGQQICWVWQEIPVPVIAAVHGHALGGGIQLALGADIRIVHPDTQMSVRETYWGLVPDMTGTFFLNRLVRPDIAKELTFTARIFSGREAGELGIATRVSETPLDDALAMAGEIAGRSPDAVRSAKALINRMQHVDAVEQFAEERSRIGALIGTPNQMESVMSGLEKRPPAFID
jgi:enoyl-CoA hydratase/carnithine racemase